MSEQSSRRQILRSSAIIGGASVINIVIGLLRMKVVAVLLGPAGVGLIGILQNLVATASTISALGFGNVGTRQIAEANGRGDLAGIDAARRALFWGTLLLAMLGGGLFWLLRDLLASRVLDNGQLASALGWLAVGVALTVATGSQNALLNGMRRIGDIARVSVFSSLLSTLLGIPLILWLGSEGIVWFILATPLASFVISHLYVARLPKIKSGATPLRVLAGQWGTLIRLGSAFMLAGMVVLLGQLAVRTLVQNELGAEQLGYFQAAWAISMTYIGFVLGAMGTDYYPRLTAVIHDHEQANKLVNEQTEVAILLAGPVLLGMLALAPWVITLLYSAEFAPAATVLRWQILGDLLKILSWPLGFVILARGAGRTFVLSESTAMLVFFIATWLLLPAFGIEATGVGFLLMYFAYLPLLYWLARKNTGFGWHWRLVVDVLVLMVLAVVTSILSPAGTWGMLAGVCIAFLYGLFSLFRLSTMTGLGGALGKLSASIKFVKAKLLC